jgi:DNA polymerase III sliding clamp (beta) subunit (PCNA family)
VASELILNKELFVTKFLQPISKLADIVTINSNDSGIYAICSTQDGSSVVLYAELQVPELERKHIRLNLPDVKKFVRLIDCIEDSVIRLTIKDNHINYNTDNIRFNYFLLEDSFVQRAPLNPEKIKALQYDSSFTLSITKFNEILKGSSIATDSDKLYFYTKDDTVYAELNDHERQNINNITYRISDNYEGAPIKNALPFNLESVRLLAGLRADSFTVRINNTLKVCLFEVEDSDIMLKFIVSALVK